MVAAMLEDAATIRKSMVQTAELHATMGSNLTHMNQVVRWITTKEQHAAKIITTVAEYCLCQRVKPDVFKTDQDYVDVCLPAAVSE